MKYFVSGLQGKRPAPNGINQRNLAYGGILGPVLGRDERMAEIGQNIFLWKDTK
jgi:hypothetical protein